jgi:hypothetical protein
MRAELLASTRGRGVALLLAERTQPLGEWMRAPQAEPRWALAGRIKAPAAREEAMLALEETAPAVMIQEQAATIASIRALFAQSTS